MCAGLRAKTVVNNCSCFALCSIMCAWQGKSHALLHSIMCAQQAMTETVHSSYARPCLHAQYNVCFAGDSDNAGSRCLSTCVYGLAQYYVCNAGASAELPNHIKDECGGGAGSSRAQLMVQLRERMKQCEGSVAGPMLKVARARQPLLHFED